MLCIVKFEAAACGCLVGRYRDTETGREVACVEASAAPCGRHHRNDLLASTPAPPHALRAAS